LSPNDEFADFELFANMINVGQPSQIFIQSITPYHPHQPDVNAIIAYASRAFALFYMFQCVVAFLVAWQHKDLSQRTLRLVNFAFLAVMCFLVFALGIPSG